MAEELTAEIQTAREEALATLTEVVDQARYKSLGDGRIRDESKEKVRLSYLRVIISAQAERRKLLADKDLDELAEKVEQLQEEHNT